MHVLLKIDRIKRIPIRKRIFWLTLLLFSIMALVGLFSTPQRTLDRARECTVTVEEARLKSTVVGRMHQTTLILRAGEDKFYLTYPSHLGIAYLDAAYEDLVSGRVTTVTVLFSSDGIFLGNWSGFYEILALRSGSTVYYDLDTAMSGLRLDYTVAVVFESILILVWLLDTVLLLLNHNVLILRGGKKPKKKEEKRISP